MTDGANRRVHERRPATGGAGCVYPTPAGERAAVIRDVSLAGVGLLLPETVEVGVTLAVRLTNPDRGIDKTVVIRVVHVTPTVEGFLVGGALTAPLTFEELTDLVT